MPAFRERYGHDPIHLVAALATFAIAGYAIFEMAGQTAPIAFLLWFAAAALLHDVVAFPVYSLFGLLAGRGAKAHPHAHRAVNAVRVPAILSGFLFIVWFPLILRFSDESFLKATGQSSDPYLGRWLLITAGLFLASGLIWALRTRLGSRSA